MLFLLTLLFASASEPCEAREKGNLKYSSVEDGYAKNVPLAWWQLDESAGDETAADVTGKHDGELFDGAPDFDGRKARVAVGTFDIDAPKMSILAWFRADDFDTADARIISKTTGTETKTHYWMLSTIKKDDKMRLRFRLKAGGNTSELISDKQELKAGEWVFVAATYDGRAMTIFQNGEIVARMKKRGRIDTNAHAHVWIGDNPSGPGSRPFDGNIKNVAVFEGALGRHSIQAIYAARETEEAQLADARDAQPKPPVVQIPDDLPVDEPAEAASDTDNNKGEPMPAKPDETEPTEVEPPATGVADESVAKANQTSDDEDDVPPAPDEGSGNRAADVIDEQPSPSDNIPSPSDVVRPADPMPIDEGTTMLMPETVIIGEGEPGPVIWSSDHHHVGPICRDVGVVQHVVGHSFVEHGVIEHGVVEHHWASHAHSTVSESIICPPVEQLWQAAPICEMPIYSAPIDFCPAPQPAIYCPLLIEPFCP